MTYTAVPTKTNGVSTITKAECNTYIRNNIEDLSERPSAKVVSGETTLSNATVTAMDLGGGSASWDTDTIFDSANDELDLNTTRAGVWYIGARTTYDNDATGKRTTLIASSGGTTFASWADQATEGKTRLSLGTALDPSGAVSVQLEGFQVSGGNLATNGSMSALWVGGITSTTDDVDDLELSASQGATNWWNSWDDNVNRLYNRPAARAYMASNFTTLADATWTRVPLDTEEYDNHAIIGAGTEYRLTAQVGGWYYVHGCVHIDNFNGTDDQVIAQFRVNGVAHGIGSGSFDVGLTDSMTSIEDIIRLDSGDYVELWVFKRTTGGNSTVAANDLATHCGMFLVSGDAPALANPRQYFGEGLPTVADFDFTAPSTDVLPRGLANTHTRDFFLHLWNPPVLGLGYTIGETTAGFGSGWSDVPFDRVRFDAWGQDQITVSDSVITVPFGGLWLVVGSVQLDNPSDFGVTTATDVGMRFTHNGNPNAASRVPLTANSYDWFKSYSNLLDCAAGDEIGLQVFHNADEDVDLRNGNLTAVWMRERP